MIAFDLAYQATLGAICKRSRAGAGLSLLYTAIATVAAVLWSEWQSMGTGIGAIAQAVALSLAYAAGTFIRPLYCAIGWLLFLAWFLPAFRPLDVERDLLGFLLGSTAVNGGALVLARRGSENRRLSSSPPKAAERSRPDP